MKRRKRSIARRLPSEKELFADFPAVPEYAVQLGGSYCNLGHRLKDRGQSAEALDWYQRAIQTLAPVVERMPRLPAARDFLRNSHGGRAGAFGNLKRFADAEGEHRAALDLGRRLVAEFPAVPEYRAGLATSHNSLGSLLLGRGRHAEAEVEYRQAIVIRGQLASDFPAMPEYAVHLGGSYCNLGSVLTRERQTRGGLGLVSAGDPNAGPRRGAGTASVHRPPVSAQQPLGPGQGLRQAQTLRRCRRGLGSGHRAG